MFFEYNVEITAGVSKEIVEPRSKREGCFFQVQASGVFWLSFSGHAGIREGFCFKAPRVVDVSQGFPLPGNVLKFYEGPVFLFWEGFETPSKTQHPVL